METPQDSMGRADEVVLDEFGVTYAESTSAVRLGEVPAFIHVAWRSDQEYIGDFERCEI